MIVFIAAQLLLEREDPPRGGTVVSGVGGVMASGVEAAG